MVVSLKVGFRLYTIGSPDFFHCFFSTVYKRLENDQWGSRFPIIMNNLYQGELSFDKVEQAIQELKEMQLEFRKFDPTMVVWDFEDLSKMPPWGDNISSEIHDLSEYFVTSEGEDLFDILFLALTRAYDSEKNVEIRSL